MDQKNTIIEKSAGVILIIARRESYIKTYCRVEETQIFADTVL